MNSASDVEFAASYEKLVLIRCFEEALLELYTAGGVPGTTHTCIGQEANAVGIIQQLDLTRDNVVSNHRNHGHYIAFTDDVDGLIHEILGRKGGICEGRGGSQHLHSGRFLSNGVQGGIVPVAAGMALAEKKLSTGAVTVVFIGDGTLGQGVVYETLNMASLWSLPLLVVVENNRYAQTTPIERALAGSLLDRAKAFGIASEHLASTDVEVIGKAAERATKHVREKSQPFWLVIDTYRFAPHSKGDDYRSKTEIASHQKLDPILLAGARLSSESRETVLHKARARIAAAIACAKNAPDPLVPPAWLLRSGASYT